MNILFLSHTYIGSNYVVGSHHLARELGLKGHRVLHVATPVSLLHIINPRSFIQRLKAGVWRAKKVYLGVDQLIPLTLLPVSALGTNTISSKLKGCIKAHMRSENIDKFDACFIDAPLLYTPQLKEFCIKVIYRPTDLYNEMGSASAIKEKEEKILTESDGLLATNSNILSYLQGNHKIEVPCDVIINGFDYNHFNNESRGYDRFGAVYVGAIDDRFDEDLLVDFEKKSGSNLALYSPEKPSTKELRKYHRGAIPYAEVPAILEKAKVLIMPFKDNAVNRSRSPMKLFEYAASGATIVMPSFMDSHGLKNVILYGNRSEFLPSVIEALFREPALEENSILSENSWEVKAMKLLEFLRKC